MITKGMVAFLRTGIGRRLAARLQAAMVARNPPPTPAIDVAADPARPLLDMVYRSDLHDPCRLDFNVSKRPERRVLDRGRPLTINWFVPEPTGGGSGGHMNLFRLAQHLQRAGHHNRLYAIPNCFLKSDKEMRDLIGRYYCDMGDAETITDSRVIGDSDICVATGWDTAYRLYLMENTLFKTYLVQDYEPYFYGMGAHYIFAENTYRMKFYGMFGSPWLKTLMAERYGFGGTAFRYGFDPERYRHLPDVAREPDRVAVYIRPRTERRGFELVLGAVHSLCRLRPQTRITLFGAVEEIRNLPFACEQAGILDEQGLCRLYNRSTAVMLTSLTNYSIIPVEAMACGAIVLDVRAPSIQSVFTDGVHLALADADPLDMARVAARILDNAPERDRIAGQATTYIQDMNWEVVRAALAEQLLGAFYT